MNKIENVTRLETRVADADRECTRLAEAVTLAEGRWRDTVAADDSKAETAALRALETARLALDNAQARLPLLQSALVEARRAALPERAELAEAQIDAINADAREAGDRLLRAVAEVLSTVSEIEDLAGQHRFTMEVLHSHARECGVQLRLTPGLLFILNPRTAGAVRAALGPLRISERTLYRSGGIPA